MEKIYELNDVSVLTNFQESVGEWSCKTFPQSSDTSRIEHMRREILELKEEPADPYEAADIFLLLLHHAHVHGYDLMTAARKKFDIIKLRKWLPPDEMGVQHRVKDGSE